MNDFITPERPKVTPKTAPYHTTLDSTEYPLVDQQDSWTSVYVGAFLVAIVATAFVFIETSPAFIASRLPDIQTISASATATQPAATANTGSLNNAGTVSNAAGRLP